MKALSLTSLPKIRSLLLPTLFSIPLGLSTGLQCKTKRFRGIRAARMASCLDKYAGSFANNSNMGCVRPATTEYIEEAAEAVKSEQVIAVPTDTLYGFACDACSVEAVRRIYEIKGRKHTSPLAICVADVKDIAKFAIVEHLPCGLLDSLLPGPVTVILIRGESSVLEKSLNPGLESIGVRVPDCEFIRAVAGSSMSALALTSANLSGQPSSVDVKDFQNLWDQCKYIYNAEHSPRAAPDRLSSI